MYFYVYSRIDSSANVAVVAFLPFCFALLCFSIFPIFHPLCCRFSRISAIFSYSSVRQSCRLSYNSNENIILRFLG